MSSFAYIAPWVFASVTIGILVGVFLNRTRGKDLGRDTAPRERRAALTLLSELLGAADRIARATTDLPPERRTPPVPRTAGCKRALAGHAPTAPARR